MTMESDKQQSIDIIYLDLDGVVADFESKGKEIASKYISPEFHMKMKDFKESGATKEDRKKFWQAVKQYQLDGNKLWEELDLMSDAMELFEYLIGTEIPVEILTATGPTEHDADTQKRKWVQKHFGDIKVNTVRMGSHKRRYANPSALLIDDMPYAIDPFENAGGVGIVHTSARDTIEKLENLLT